MNQKLTSTLLVCMLYIQFMGPFVLRSVARRDAPKRRSLDLISFFKYFFVGILFVLFCVVMIALSIWGILAGTLAIIILGWVGVVVFAIALGVAVYILVAASDSFNRRRILSKTEGLTAALPDPDPERTAMLKKMKHYFDRIDHKENLDAQIAKAEQVTTGKNIKRWFRRKGLLGEPKPEKPMTPDQLKKAMRDLFHQEMDDVKQMKKDRAKSFTKSVGPVDRFHKPEKVRRQYMKLRLQKTIHLLFDQMMVRKQWEGSWTAIYAKFKIELDPLIARLKNKNLPQDEREKTQKEVEDILKRDYSPEKMEYQAQLASDEMQENFRYAGVPKRSQETIFFMSYMRAVAVVMMKREKIAVAKKMTESNLSPKQIEDAQAAKQKIDDAIKKICEGKDLDEKH